ncbi:DUF2169 family type VI secretion system accessory protein [Labrys neptuniae]
MDIRNFTPFPSMRYSNTLSDGRTFGIAMVKVAFDIGEDGTCTVSPEQEPFNFTDVPHGELNASSLRHPSDFVPYKPATDLIINAIAHAPDGKPAQSWLCGVEIADEAGKRIAKRLRVTGPRFWRPQWRRPLSEQEQSKWQRHRDLFKGWELSEPEPITELPIRYEYAYGGMVASERDKDGKRQSEVNERNPLGYGLIHPDWTDHTKPQPAPQIEADSQPVADAEERYTPQGLGPIPAHWLPRRPKGGTYDQNWIDSVWPKWPADYDFTFHNSAAEGLAISPHCMGDLRLRLHYLRRGNSHFDLTIPDPKLLALVTPQQGEDLYCRPRLDTVFVEMAEDDLFHCRVSLTWRLIYNRASTFEIALFAFDQAPELFERLSRDWDSLPFSLAPEECASELELPENTI